MKAYVVAVSGMPGCGSPEICDELGKKLRKAAVVHLRDYPAFCQPGSQWLEGDDSFDALDLSELRADIEKLSVSRKYDCILLDCPFGRCAKAVRSLIDYVFYIDISPDLALSRTLFHDPRLTDRVTLRSRLRLYQEYGHAIAMKIKRVVPRASDMTVYAEKDPEKTILEATETILINRAIKL